MTDAREMPDSTIVLPPYRGAHSLYPEEQLIIILGEKAALSQYFLTLAEQTPQWAARHGIRLEAYRKNLELACTHIAQAMRRRAIQETRFKILAPTKPLSLYYLPSAHQVVVSHCPRCGHDQGVIPLFSMCPTGDHDIPLPEGMSEKLVRNVALNLRHLYEADSSQAILVND